MPRFKIKTHKRIYTCRFVYYSVYAANRKAAGGGALPIFYLYKEVKGGEAQCETLLI